MTFHVLTYATHAGGTFNLMVDDSKKNGINLQVLGWGEKWTGFYGKLRAIEEQIYKFDDNDIVIVIDAFDTRINHGMDKIQTVYNNDFRNVDLLFSKSPDMVFAPNKYWNKYLYEKCFNGLLNAGLYLGRVEILKKLYKNMLAIQEITNSDDQRAINYLSKKFNMVADEHNKMFLNVEYRDRHIDSSKFDAIFCGYPGTMNLERLWRAPKEYGPFFKEEILCIFLVLLIATLTVMILKNGLNCHHRILRVA